MSFMESNKVRLRVFVASKTQVKVDVVRDVFQERFGDIIEVQGLAADSLVANQPIGSETQQGCENRAQHVLAQVAHSEWDVIVSIENGVYDSVSDPVKPSAELCDMAKTKTSSEDINQRYYDTCMVQIIAGTSFQQQHLVHTSTAYTSVLASDDRQDQSHQLTIRSEDVVFFPAKYYNASIASKQVSTAGSLIEEDLHIAAGCWHEKFHSTQKTRYDLIKACLVAHIK